MALLIKNINIGAGIRSAINEIVMILSEIHVKTKRYYMKEAHLAIYTAHMLLSVNFVVCLEIFH